MLYQPNAYGQGLSSAFQAAFTGTITGSYPLQPGLQSYQTVLGQIYGPDGGSPDGVLMVTDNPADGAQVMSDYISSYQTKNTFWLMTDALDNTNFASGITGAAPAKNEGTVPSASSGANFDAFKASFTSTYGQAPLTGNFDEHYYDAVYLAVLAIEAAGKTDGTSIATHLQAVSSGTGTKYAASEFVQALADIDSGKAINYDGASGPVDFDQNGDVVAPYDIWQVQQPNNTISVIAAGQSP